MFYDNFLQNFFERSVTPKLNVVINMDIFHATIYTNTPEKFIDTLNGLDFVNMVTKRNDGLSVTFHRSFYYSEEFESDFLSAVHFLDA